METCMTVQEQGQPHYPYPKTNLKEAEVLLDNVIQSFFKDVLNYRKCKNENDFLALRVAAIPPYRKQIIAPAGMGKTTKVAEHLALCKGMNVWFMVPNHILAKEVTDTLESRVPGAEVILIKGRREETCARSKLASRLGGRGLSVQESLCKNDKALCPYFSSCLYQEQGRLLNDMEKLKETDPPRIFVMTHSFLTIHSNIPGPDLIIVDESHWQSFIDITGQINGAPDLSFDDITAAYDKSREHYEDHKLVIEEIISALREKPLSFLRLLEDIDLSTLDNAIAHIHIPEASDINPDQSDEVIKKHSESWEKRKVQKIKQMLKTIRYEIKIGKGTSSIQCDLDNAAQIRLHNLKQNMIDRRTPVLLIDASASLEINSKIWGHRLQNVEIKVERNAQVFQVRKRTFSKYSLGIAYSKNSEWTPEEDKVELRKGLITFINEIAEQTSSKVFCAGSKSVIAAIKGGLSSNVLTSHYGALRGRNEFENCEIGIVIGREEPPIESVRGIARALLSHSKDSISIIKSFSSGERERRLKDGNTETETVRRDLIPLIQEVLEQIREREMEQAIDRLRLIHNKDPKTVFILSSIVLDVTVDKTQVWEGFLHITKMDAAINQALKESPVFLLGATDLARRFSDIWSSRDAVRKYIQRRGGIKWVVSLIRYYIPNDPLLLVEYRRVGKRGRASRAIVSKNQICARTGLEMVVGPLSKFNVIKEIEDEDDVD